MYAGWGCDCHLLTSDLTQRTYLACPGKADTKLSIKCDLFLQDESFRRADLQRKLVQIDKKIDFLNSQYRSLQVDYDKFQIEVNHIIDTFRDFPKKYRDSDDEKKVLVLREIADAVVLDGANIEFQFKKPYVFFMRQGIMPINKVDVFVSSKTSTSAANNGLGSLLRFVTAVHAM